MMRPVAVLCFVITAAPVFGIWDKSLKVRFDVNPFGIGTTSFIEMPKSTKAASDECWDVVIRPNGPEGYSHLTMMCPKNNYAVCVLFDDTGYIAGLQIALDQTKFSSHFDLGTQGFTNWTIITNGKTENFYTMQQYYVSSEFLKMDAETRLAKRNSKTLLQDTNIYVTGFNGALYNISTTVKDFTEHSIYKKQACVPWMGNHYYYNMTPSVPCQADTMFPWFPLVYSDHLIGVGFVVFGKYDFKSGPRNYFEHPGKRAAKMIVPRGPACMYDLADSPGLLTMHTYFIKHPQFITCL